MPASLLTGQPPDPELTARIRLAHPRVLVFFDAVPLTEFGDDVARRVDVRKQLSDHLGHPPPESLGLTGVLLSAGHDGVGLLPWVMWLISAHTESDNWSVTTLEGLWEQSAFADAVANLAAMCTWGAWTPPPASPPQIEGEEGTRTWRRSLHRSGARRALRGGALLDVQSLDLQRSLHAVGAGDEESTTAARRTVRPHPRRAYWTTVRVATRDEGGNIIGNRLGEVDVDYHLEGRWAPPTFVNAHLLASDPGRLRVYQVPDRSM